MAFSMGPICETSQGVNGDQAGLGNVQVGHLVQRRGRAVIVHADVVQEAQRGAAGADGGHFVLQIGDGLLHARLDVVLDFLDGVESRPARGRLYVRFS